MAATTALPPGEPMYARWIVRLERRRGRRLRAVGPHALNSLLSKRQVGDVAPPRRGHPAVQAETLDDLLAWQMIGRLHVPYRLRHGTLERLAELSRGDIA